MRYLYPTGNLVFEDLPANINTKASNKKIWHLVILQYDILVELSIYTFFFFLKLNYSSDPNDIFLLDPILIMPEHL